MQSRSSPAYLGCVAELVKELMHAYDARLPEVALASSRVIFFVRLDLHNAPHPRRMFSCPTPPSPHYTGCLLQHVDVHNKRVGGACLRGAW